MVINCGASSQPGGELKASGCASRYQAGPHKLPEEGHTLSPWVTVKFLRNGATISVGNKSSPQNDHNAVIKSFDFGRSDGYTCKIVIQDQQGSSLIQFMEDMLKDARCATPDSLRMQVQYGWVKSGCNAPFPDARSDCYCMYPESIVTNFQAGKFTYEITGRDLIHAMLEQHGDKVYGGDGDSAKPLKNAIEEMMTDEEIKPTVTSVKFCKMEGKQRQCDVKFYDSNDEKGPPGKWEMDNRTKIDTAREWLKNHRSADNKGWKVSYNGACDAKGEVVFWEDPKPNCNEAKDWESNCLGFYIVNGSKSSPVIEFNPSIKWDFARLHSQGGAATSAKPQLEDDGKVKGRAECGTLSRQANPSAGTQVAVTTDETNKNIYGENAEDESSKSQEKAHKAEKIFHDNIEADLVIIGDPTMVSPALAPWAFNVSIAFINPFHLIGSSSGRCGEWLAQPMCNEVLSNKAWIVKSIGHSITEGKYTTTLGLYLTTPGDDIDAGSPIGGTGSGGWTPPAAC